MYPVAPSLEVRCTRCKNEREGAGRRWRSIGDSASNERLFKSYRNTRASSLKRCPDRVHDLVVAAVKKEFVDPVDTVVLGLSTSPPDKQEALGIASKIGRSLGAKRVIVTDDSVTHHASFFRGSPGIALAIGTGVACISVGNQKDSMFSVSGYGYLLGDDGGGFSIGRNALRLALDTQFERPDSKMVELALVDSDRSLLCLPRCIRALGQ